MSGLFVGRRQQTQQQSQIQQKVLKRQLMLNQLDNTFIVLDNYCAAISSRDQTSAGIQNEAAASAMNALRAQVLLAKIRKDSDVLVMGLSKVKDFRDGMATVYEGNANVTNACGNYLGFMTAVLSGHRTEQLPCGAMPDDPEVINAAMGDFLGAIHENERVMREISNRPHETAQQQEMLLVAAQQGCFDRRGQLAMSTEYNFDALSAHFECEKTFYDRERSKRKVGAGEVAMDTDDGGFPNLGFDPDPQLQLSGFRHTHTHGHEHEHGAGGDITMAAGVRSTPERFMVNGADGWQEVQVLSQKKSQAKVRVICSGKELVVDKRDLHRLQ